MDCLSVMPQAGTWKVLHIAALASGLSISRPSQRFAKRLLQTIIAIYD